MYKYSPKYEIGIIYVIFTCMYCRLPTDVQAEAIPLILGGGDVLMAAETGSGKTGAFCLPIVQIVWETLRDIADGKTIKSEIKESKYCTLGSLRNI